VVYNTWLLVSCCFVLAAEQMMSYTQHADLMRVLFAQLGVDTTKLTHELRIFAAQLLYEMGVPLEVRAANGL
jgi:hypothetical protein